MKTPSIIDSKFSRGSKRIPFMSIALLMILLMVSCSKEDLASEELTGVALKTRSETLKGQLKKARSAAMRFHSFKQAEQQGYADPYPFNPSPYVPHMGYHYINVGLMDGSFELEKPEILLYVPNKQGKLKLVGIEYAVPVALSPNPPEGFVGEEDHWEYNPNVAGGAWTLHAWVVMDNPDGIFAPMNPDVPATDPSLDD